MYSSRWGSLLLRTAAALAGICCPLIFGTLEVWGDGMHFSTWTPNTIVSSPPTDVLSSHQLYSPPFLASTQITSTSVLTLSQPISSSNVSTSTQSVVETEPALYEDMLSHFEKVSSHILETAKWVVIIVGGLGGAAGILGSYLTIKSTADIHSLNQEREALEGKVKQISDKVENMIENLQTAESKLEELIAETQKVQDRVSDAFGQLTRFYHLQDIRNKSPDVRIRVAQQLGESNDIRSMSLLADLLEDDLVPEVKVEAAYGLGQLLSVGGEYETLLEGVRVLLNGTRDENEHVRRESVEAMCTILSNGIELPRIAVQRLHEILKHDKSADVIEAATFALKQIRKQQEGKLGSQEEEQNP